MRRCRVGKRRGGEWGVTLVTARAGGQELRKFNQFVQTSNSPAMRLLREGRDDSGRGDLRCVPSTDQDVAPRRRYRDFDRRIGSGTSGPR